ncbi:MAG: DUF86 domain-containing protein [Oscillospiraceae bacterium]|jgi:uncharacterized protein with HEPN domain|nr:DUF86 domain-containing protein [Oscillospiraceae bacterium]
MISKQERDEDYIEHMADELDFIRAIYVKINQKLFEEDALLQHALMMSLLTIGECAKKLSDEFKTNYTEIEWAKISGLRNVAAHVYWQIDMVQIWNALENHIPKLDKFVSGIRK